MQASEFAVRCQSKLSALSRPPAAEACNGAWRHLARGLIFSTCCLGFHGAAQAERADRGKPINLEADRMHVDDAQKISVFEGRVVMTQGTLTIRGDTITVRQDKEGHQYGTASGNLAKFRQKRDGADEYVEGEAERIEYDGKLDRVELFNRARLKREPADEVRGNYISYDSRTEQFAVNGGPTPATSGGPDGRVRAVIQPRNTTEPPGKPSSPAAGKP
jgi:lipopolysaccharide export system protein LptA